MFKLLKLSLLMPFAIFGAVCVKKYADEKEAKEARMAAARKEVQ